MITSDYQHAERTEKAQKYTEEKGLPAEQPGEQWREVEEKEERLELLIHSGRKRKREGGSETT